MKTVPGRCPYCFGRLVIERLRCSSCRTSIDGKFPVSRLITGPYGVMKYLIVPSLFALALSGCMAIRSTVKQKETSIGSLSDVRINNTEVDDYITERLAWVFPEKYLDDAEIKKTEDETSIRYEFNIEVNRIGLATAISSDGYFLTAAHCIRRNDRFVSLFPCSGGLPTSMDEMPDEDEFLDHFYLAKVIWKSTRYDVALIKGNIPTKKFEISEHIPRIGENVISGGTAVSGGLSAGRILKTKTKEAYIKIVYHDAPLRGGDSGGPLITHDGSLVGINSRDLWSFTGKKTGVSIFVDASYIKDIMERNTTVPLKVQQ